MDPFLDLIELLRPRATLWRRLEGNGRWGLAFHRHDDLLFCWLAEGTCLLARPSEPALPLAAGDFVLVRTCTPFALLSHADAVPEDSEAVFASDETLAASIGDGAGPRMVLHGGKFVFRSANEDMLTSLLPPVLHVSAAAGQAERLQALLAMNAEESHASRPGSEFVIARLMELILVEILRGKPLTGGGHPPGMLAGLADPVAGPALRAIHGDLAHGWTVAELARRVGVSRSVFAERFHRAVGVGPIEYLQEWRMARARDELRRGDRTIAEIAFAAGFQSASAFSTAFRKRVGSSPRAFAAKGDPAPRVAGLR